MGMTRVPVTIKALDGGEQVFRSDFLVDTGATDCLVPATQLRRINVQPIGRTSYEHADGTVHDYPFGLARVELLGEVTAGRVIFGPDEAEPLLGVTALESVGLTVDPASGVLEKLPAIPLK